MIFFSDGDVVLRCACPVMDDQFDAEWVRGELSRLIRVVQERQSRIPSVYRKDNPSMPEIVRRLETLPANQVLVARKIQHFGLESKSVLFRHFNAIQLVSEVLLCHTLKKGATSDQSVRLRPARVAFVVFAEPVRECLTDLLGVNYSVETPNGPATIILESFTHVVTTSEEEE